MLSAYTDTYKGGLQVNIGDSTEIEVVEKGDSE